MKKQEKMVRRHFGQSFLSRGARQLILTAASLLLVAVFVLVACSAPQRPSGQPNAGQQSAATDWKAVQQALSKAGSMQPGDVYKASLPRSDLQITVNGVQLKPALALGSWLAFKKSGNI